MALRKVEIEMHVPSTVGTRELAEYVTEAVRNWCNKHAHPLYGQIKVDLVLVTKIKKEDAGGADRVAVARAKLGAENKIGPLTMAKVKQAAAAKAVPAPVVKKGRR